MWNLRGKVSKSEIIQRWKKVKLLVSFLPFLAAILGQYYSECSDPCPGPYRSRFGEGEVLGWVKVGLILRVKMEGFWCNNG